MIMAPGDLKAYNEATECWICKGPFLKPAPEIVQKLDEAKYNLLEIKEWKSYPIKSSCTFFIQVLYNFVWNLYNICSGV